MLQFQYLMLYGGIHTEIEKIIGTQETVYTSVFRAKILSIYY